MTYGYDGGPNSRLTSKSTLTRPSTPSSPFNWPTKPRWIRYETRFSPARSSDTYAASTGSSSSTKNCCLGPVGAACHAYGTPHGQPCRSAQDRRAVPAGASVRSDPDFLWMLARPAISRARTRTPKALLALFRASRPNDSRKAAAAYALCGVYRGTGNVRNSFGRPLASRGEPQHCPPRSIEDLSVYWHPALDLNSSSKPRPPSKCSALHR